MSDVVWRTDKPETFTWAWVIRDHCDAVPAWYGNDERWRINGQVMTNITHWAEMELPAPPEPPKSDIQVACEWLGICTIDYDHELEPDALYWRIERALVRAKHAAPSWSDLFVKDAYRLWVTCEGDHRAFEASTRGEALLNAALWLKEQEANDGC